MRLKFYLPLVFFLALTGFVLLFLPSNLRVISGLIMFLAGFVFTYSSGINETIKNKDAVIKIHNKTPILIPLTFFLIPNFILALLWRANYHLFIQYISSIIIGVITYLVGILLVIRDLKQSMSGAIQISSHLKSKKLLLINPVNPGQTGVTVNKSSIFPPLGLGIIAALTPEDFEVKIIDENIESFKFENADLVGITAFTASSNRAYELAAIYREQKIPVIMGGIHASMLPDEALKFVDTVVIGEAETIWEEVISDFCRGELKQVYRGQFPDLKNTTVPKRELFSNQYLFATIQTSRGCPIDCYFCSVTPFNGKKYRQRPYEEVLDELGKIPQQMIFFVDDNLLGYGKEAEERAINLFKGMLERKLNKKWFCQASLNFGDNEEVTSGLTESYC